jgi:hypothetical protein
VNKYEREAFYTKLTDHLLLSDSTKVMETMEDLVHDPDVNVFDRQVMVRELVEAWQSAREDIVIPANPHNHPYVLISVSNPRHFVFFLNREQGIAMRDANGREGYTTRLVDCNSGKVVME